MCFQSSQNLVMSKCVLKPLGYWGHYNPLGIEKEFNHVNIITICTSSNLSKTLCLGATT